MISQGICVSVHLCLIKTSSHRSHVTLTVHVCWGGTSSATHQGHSWSQGNTFNRWIKSHHSAGNMFVVMICCCNNLGNTASVTSVLKWKREYWVLYLADIIEWNHKKTNNVGGGMILWVDVEKEWEHSERIFSSICAQQLGLFTILLRDCNT